MSSFQYKVVLSDKLYSIYKKASLNLLSKSRDRKIYDNLIPHIEFDILTNAAQLTRCKEHHDLPEEVYNDLYPQLIKLSNKDLDLVELAEETLFKVIITQTTGHEAPPYYNINEDSFKRNYTITRLHEQDRHYLTSYLKHLLQQTNNILIHDKYFSSNDDNKKFIELLPDKEMTIQFIENPDNNNGNFIRHHFKNNKWKIEKCDTTTSIFNRFARSHDRYLVIDNKIEITFTSGFIYLWDKTKEITGVFREYKLNN